MAGRRRATTRHLSSRAAAAIAVGLALLVAALWYRRTSSTPPVATPAVDAIVSVRITRRDSQSGMPTSPKPIMIRDRTRVRAIVEALGIDTHPPIECPADYATADLGLLLSGRDIYARRNVYVWTTTSDASDASDAAAASASFTVITVTSAGCRGGPPLNADALRRELDQSDAGVATGVPSANSR